MAAALPASVDIMQYDSVIFDLDHTLIRYNLHPLFELIFDSLRQFLVDVRYDFEVVFFGIVHESNATCGSGSGNNNEIMNIAENIPRRYYKSASILSELQRDWSSICPRVT